MSGPGTGAPTPQLRAPGPGSPASWPQAGRGVDTPGAGGLGSAATTCLGGPAKVGGPGESHRAHTLLPPTRILNEPGPGPHVLLGLPSPPGPDGHRAPGSPGRRDLGLGKGLPACVCCRRGSILLLGAAWSFGRGRRPVDRARPGVDGMDGPPRLELGLRGHGQAPSSGSHRDGTVAEAEASPGGD